MTSRSLDEDDSWRFIDQLILDSAGASGLDDLAARLPGVYPPDLRRRLRGLERRLGAESVARLGTYIPDRRPLEVLKSSLPIPHPLDFEWRFTRQTCDELVDIAAARPETTARPRVALFGTPNLGEHIAKRRPDLEATLFEKRPEACQGVAGYPNLTVRNEDLALLEIDGLKDGFDIVVSDPPWYHGVTQVFVHTAASLLRTGGRLVLCAPGIGTRPSVANERLILVAFCYEHGLFPSETRPLAVEYESPPFELAALAACGLQDFNSRWRRGDLLVLSKIAPPQAFARQVDKPDSPWEEICVGDSRIRVKQDSGWAGDVHALTSLVPGNVLDSVSTRDDRRNMPNVWTSSNRVYRTSDPVRLLLALETIRDGEQRSSDSSGFSDAAKTIVDAETRFLAALRQRTSLC